MRIESRCHTPCAKVHPRRLRVRTWQWDIRTPRYVAVAFVVGDAIEADFYAKGSYYGGVIKRVRDNGTYDIRYEDGEVEVSVPASMVRAKKAAQTKPIEEEAKRQIASAFATAAGDKSEAAERREELKRIAFTLRKPVVWLVTLIL